MEETGKQVTGDRLDEKTEQEVNTLENEKLARKISYDEAVALVSSSGVHGVEDQEFTSPSMSPTIVAMELDLRVRPVLARKLSQHKPVTEVPDFPEISVRTSQKNIDERIIKCTIQCFADHNVSRNDVAGIIIKTTNVIFGQNWTLHSKLGDDNNVK